MRVVDLSHLVAGPFCTALLADLGAEVIKVEPPAGDDSRRFHPILDGESMAFLQINRGKQSVCLDLKVAACQDWLHRLVATADVFVESFKPGTARRLGLDYSTLQAINPQLVYASISGFGQTGPLADRAGVDLIAQGMSGIMAATGEPGRPPIKVSMPVTDLAAGMYAAVGILSAHARRLQTGEGQYVETSLLDAGAAWQVWELASWAGTGQIPPKLGSAHRLTAPYQAFPTATDYITIAVPNQKLWEALCQVLDAPHLAEDPRFADNEQRTKHREELAAAIATITRQHDSDTWLRRLADANIPSGPILDIEAMTQHPQIQAREMVRHLDHPKAGPVPHFNVPLKFSRDAVGPRVPAPALGASTETVLRELGADDDTLRRLGEEGGIP